MTLYLFKHSNYYNRILKRYDDINDYIENSIQLGVYQNINFKPYDGVQTSQILNHQGETPDYIVCVDDSLAINSRWYVVEDERLLNGQYRYTLLRDVIADYYGDILSAPCFVEKALLPHDSPFIYNKEDMSFNQFKTGEFLLKDTTNSRWIVGYVNSGVDKDNVADVSGEFVKGQTSTDGIVVSDSIFEILNSDKKYYLNDDSFIPVIEFGAEKYSDSATIGYNWQRYRAQIGVKYTYNTRGYYSQYILDKYGWAITYSPDFISSIIDNDTQAPIIIDTALNALGNDNDSRLVSIAKDVIDNKMNINIISQSDYAEIKELVDSETIITRGDRRYQVIIESITPNQDPYSSDNCYYFKDDAWDDAMYIINKFNNWLLDLGANSIMTDNVSDNNDIIRNTINGNSEFPDIRAMNIHLPEVTNIIKFGLKEVHTNEIYYNISGSAGRIRNDSGLYDMFAIPYDDLFVKVRRNLNSGSIDTFRTNSKLALEIAYNVSLKLTKDRLYDLQILPYCPCPEYVQGTEINFESNDDVGRGYYNTVRVKRGETEDPDQDRIIGLILWCRTNKRNFTINGHYNDIPNDIYSQQTNPLNKKIQTLTKSCRLCSPGYTSIFEIDPAMNNGIANYIVDFLYQPINPFIRISPEFKNLYGIYTQYDSKGLILKGDFSLPIIQDRWEEYQVNNKNYSEIYDREIQNLKLTQNIERKQQMWQIGAGAVSATTSGATAGAMASGGNPIGAVVGGVAGGGASLMAGMADLKYADILRAEALDYKQDMFGYALGNIRALPQTLTKSSPLSNNNPVWPILEIYESTPEERVALIEKIKYNGMSVGVIGTLSEYKDYKDLYKRDGFQYMYFKGQPIRLETIFADAHIANAISNELNRGIYL